MDLNPVIPFSGLAGWRFLERTQERQQELFNRSASIQRDVDYFRENIGNVETSQDLVSDRRLLSVALGAFGLGEELDKRAFVRNILDQGVFDPQSFANRLGNPAYIAFTEMFSFADGGFFPTSGRVDEIVDNFLIVGFETAVGNVDNSMRLAMNFKREMADLAGQGLTQTTGWLRALGSRPIRAVLEGAFNLPPAFSQIDIDQQVGILVDKAKLLFGSDSIDIFSDPQVVDDAIRRFQLREQVNNGPGANTRGMTALSILGGGLGSTGIENLLLSNV
ncbi:MAG: DUF1217 domain-containing protein [Robiginitomaculum sp.]|nr:DUF1217 domain-containing protein [Robiginitomaculum sp.]